MSLDTENGMIFYCWDTVLPLYHVQGASLVLMLVSVVLSKYLV